MDAPSNLRRDSCFYISGNVQVHPSAAIAPGVFLQADADSRLVIGPKVSIGSGALLHAQGGVLSLAAQVTLGTGVLVMGQGRIGAGACIGANTTLLFTISVEPDQLIEAGTIVGEDQGFGGATAGERPWGEETLIEETIFEEAIAEEGPFPGQSMQPDSSKPNQESNSGVSPRSTQVYGRVVVERLMRMMSSGQRPEGAPPSSDSPSP